MYIGKPKGNYCEYNCEYNCEPYGRWSFGRGLFAGDLWLSTFSRGVIMAAELLAEALSAVDLLCADFFVGYLVDEGLIAEDVLFFGWDILSQAVFS